LKALLLLTLFLVSVFGQAENVNVQLYRSYNGTFNNLDNIEWGSEKYSLIRKLPIRFDDGISTPTGGYPSKLVSARQVSNIIMNREAEYDVAADTATSMLFVFWGQFIDHDITFSFDSSTYNQCDPFLIPVPKGDLFYDSADLGGQTINFCRLIPQNNTGTSTSNPRQFPNFITSWLDGSIVYGYTNQRNNALRTFQGGLMKTSPGVDGDYMPINSNGNGGTLIDMANPAAKVPSDQLFAGGDMRANENPVLQALQTVFVREHNRRAKLLANSGLNDEEIFQQARLMVVSHIQKISYEDFLPLLIGSPLPAYKGYNSSVNPGIAEFFSTVAYRVGHDMLPTVIPRLDPNGNSIPQGSMLLRDGFFDMANFLPIGASAILRGASVTPQRQADGIFEDDVRVFLYGAGPATATDLVARNMQRARDVGIGFYNDARTAYGLSTCSTFSCVTSNPNIVNLLNQLYGTNNISFLDCYAGGVLEAHLPGAKVGPLFAAAIADQFQRMRDGDRFFYKNPGVLSAVQLAEIEATTLSQIILRNTDSTVMPPDPFNRQNVDAGVVFNPPNNTPYIVAIVIISIIAAILIIVVVGLCFSKSSQKRQVNDNQLYTNLVSDEIN